MTDKEKAKELASLLVGEDQNQEPLVKILMEMAQWKKQQMIDKACKWLKDHLWEYDQGSVIQIDAKDITDDLKQAMED